MILPPPYPFLGQIRQHAVHLIRQHAKEHQLALRDDLPRRLVHGHEFREPFLEHPRLGFRPTRDRYRRQAQSEAGEVRNVVGFGEADRDGCGDGAASHESRADRSKRRLSRARGVGGGGIVVVRGGGGDEGHWSSSSSSFDRCDSVVRDERRADRFDGEWQVGDEYDPDEEGEEEEADGGANSIPRTASYLFVHRQAHIGGGTTVSTVST